MNDNRAQDLAALLLRLTFGGLMILNHGLPKLLKFLEGDPSQFGNPLGLGPEVSLGLAIFAELLCAGLVVLGLFTRLALVPLIFTMLVAAFIVKWPNGLESMELALLYLVPFVTLLITGPGWFSLDRLLKRPI
jgi:putative oxidoreductase